MIMGRPKGSGKKDMFPLLTEEFQNFVNGASDDDLKQKLVDIAKSESDVVKTRKDDQKLTELKEEVKDMSEPYSTALKEINQKRSFLVAALEGRGKL